MQDAYDRGRTDASAEPAETDETDGQAAPAGRSPGRGRRPTSSGSSSSGVVDRAARSASRSFPLPIPSDGGGLILGLILYALGYNFLAGGAPQARGWLAAKFLNRPYGAAPEGTAQPAAASAAGSGGPRTSTSIGGTGAGDVPSPAPTGVRPE